MIDRVRHHRRTARLLALAMQPVRGSSVILVNLHSQDSIDHARAAGGGRNVTQLQTTEGSVAMSDFPGDKTVISMDRVFEAARNAGIDLDKAEDRERLDRYLEQLIVHEYLHTLGVRHAERCPEPGEEEEDHDRERDEVMHPTTNLSDDILQNVYRRSDLERIAGAYGVQY